MPQTNPIKDLVRRQELDEAITQPLISQIIDLRVEILREVQKLSESIEIIARQFARNLEHDK